MTGPRFALIPSPLLGASSWRPVALALDTLGQAALAVDYNGFGQGDSYDAVADRAAAAIGSAKAPLILVAHSGAGGLLTGIAARTAPAGMIFVDAILPHPGRSWLDTTPPGLARRLRGLAKDGRLPPWNRWFSDDPVAKLALDAGQKDALTAEIPAAPLSYLEAKAPDWPLPTMPCAYVQLSGAYALEAIAARNAEWALSKADLHHLAMLTDPDKVAELLVRAAEGLGAG